MSKNILLAIDIGNTNIVAAGFLGSEIKFKFRITSKPIKTADELDLLFTELLKKNDVKKEDIFDVIISSVVPALDFEVRKFLENNFKLQPKFISDYTEKLGIKIMLPNPAEVGSDRLVNAIAAYTKYKSSLIIIDFGTATTFDVVNANGDYLGGVIAGGVNLSLEALQNAAAKLPKIDIKAPEKVIGTSTISAMQSGIFFGYKGLIEGIISEIKNENPQNYKVIATGGLAGLFATATNLIEAVDDDLTLHGLNIIYNRLAE
jgi:type III pantothenate kinase